jgi:hypothetical protein
VGAELFQADRQILTKLPVIVAFRSFANASKQWHWIWSVSNPTHLAWECNYCLNSKWCYRVAFYIRKFKITKYENLTQQIKNIWKLINVPVYLLVISGEGVVTKNFLKCLENIGVWQKNGTIAYVSCSTLIPRTRPLTLGDRMNFLPKTDPNPTDSLGQVKVSTQRDAERCD